MVSEFLDKLEDEICKRTDIDDFELFITSLTKELNRRYLDNAEGDIRTQFALWNTKTLVNVIPECNYEPMIRNLLGIIGVEKKQEAVIDEVF